jgi:hypothetical protein
VFIVGDKSLQARVDTRKLINQFPGAKELALPKRVQLEQTIDVCAKQMQDECLAELLESQMRANAPDDFFPEQNTKGKTVRECAPNRAFMKLPCAEQRVPSCGVQHITVQ